MCAVNIGTKTLGCLGQQTSDSVRLAVVQHDIARLAERLRNGVAVSTYVLYESELRAEP